jgi:hypothetical protein
MSRLARPLLLFAATAALGACTAYDRYGYGGTSVGVSVGYGSGYPYGGYYSRYPYYGWYDGFYYPGLGYYIYDRYGQRHRWNDHHRRYWEARRGDRRYWRERRENWNGYQPSPDGVYGWRTQPAQRSAPSGASPRQRNQGVVEAPAAPPPRSGGWRRGGEGAQPAPRAQTPRSEGRPAARPQRSRSSEGAPSRGGWRTAPRADD